MSVKWKSVRFGRTRLFKSIHLISEKRNLSITNENRKATFEVFAINPVFRDFV